MGLMPRYRHQVIVQRTKPKTGTAGQSEREDDGEPVMVRGNMHSLDAEEVVLWGDRGRLTEKFFCRLWPGDMFSKITFEGEAWDQVAPALESRFTRKQVRVILRKR